MNSPSERILIVDDDATPLALLKDLLAGEGYYPDSAESGEGALKKLRSYSYKVLVTDLKMPGMSGMNLLDYCIRHYPELPVIILTAYGTIQSAVEALKRGAFDYLTKPIQMDELVIAIEKAIVHERLKTQNTFI